MARHFGYTIDKRYLAVLLPFGLRPGKDGVTLTDDSSMVATFGFFRLATPLANVTGAHITRGYRWWTAFGVRGSMADDGLSFGPTTTEVSAFTSPKKCHRHFDGAVTRRSP